MLAGAGCSTTHTQSKVPQAPPVQRAPEVYQLTINAVYARANDCGKRLQDKQRTAEYADSVSPVNVVTNLYKHATFEFAYTALECSNLEINEDTVRSVTAAFFSEPGESLLSQKRKVLKRQAFVDGVVRLSSSTTTKSTENKSPEDTSTGCYSTLGQPVCPESRY